MIVKINNILLNIFVVLVIFCICSYVYRNANVSDIIKIDHFNNIADNKTILLELMKNAKDNAIKVLKEKFLVDERLILQKNAVNYYNNLNAFQSWLDNTYEGEYGIIAKLNKDLETASETRLINKQEILKLLTNIYIINYINFINRQNAESYKMFLKYETPENNKYYKQYLK
jgi:hypothetical protein